MTQYTYAKFFNGYIPVFRQFGQDIYASDVVQICIDIIATEISKLQPKHIRTDNNGLQSIPKTSINRLFKFSPNEIMTTRDFLEKVIWQLYLNYNCFIYPMYEIITKNGRQTKEYTGFYPLAPTQVDFLQDSSGTLFVKLTFSNGTDFTLRYSDLIHLRKKFSINEIMGGGMNGQPDNSALLQVLKTNDTVLQGLDKGIKTSMAVRLVAKINTMTDTQGLKAEREKFEEQLRTGESGILASDLKGEITPIKVDPKIIDKDTMSFLESKVLNWYGVSVPILTGDFTDEQYQAFYERTLEPILISLGQAFSKCLFTSRELDVGNEIVFYQKKMMYLSAKTKLDLLQTVGEQGLLTDDEKLAILGYPPLKDGSGNRRTMSLNYIDVNLVNAYQMNNMKSTTGKGGKNNEE
ncbi:phage portal protein [Alkalicella caledoniensis]|uniref:Phage portal protein n=2 Tax=Alkalicella caledoniensis TaxID=2731377 RepID=A0A7G9WD94_ALKCA|nr:phage portal protein [Alkalicella caledoniensis]